MPGHAVHSRLSIEDAAYLAGLVDGEGSITLSRKHAGEGRQLVVSISSTERCILEYVKTVIRVGKITSKRVTRAHHQPGLTCAVSNRQALSLLAEVRPYLRSYKRARCDLVLQRYLELTPRNGKYTPALRLARNAFEREFLQLTTRIRPTNTVSPEISLEPVKIPPT